MTDDKRAYPMPTPAEDLLRALHDPLGYWEERAAAAERERDRWQRRFDRLEEQTTDPYTGLGATRRALTVCASERDDAEAERDDAEAERDRWRQAAMDAAQHEDELAERLSLANAALARVLALAEHWDAQALEQAAYGQNAQAAILAVDARALRQAVNGDQPDDGGGKVISDKREGLERPRWKPQGDPRDAVWPGRRSPGVL